MSKTSRTCTCSQIRHKPNIELLILHRIIGTPFEDVSDLGSSMMSPLLTSTPYFHSCERCARAIHDTGGSCWIGMPLSLRLIERFDQHLRFNYFTDTHMKRCSKKDLHAISYGRVGVVG